MISRHFVVVSYCLFGWGSAVAESPYFEMQVIDADTKRGVPLVELKTVNGIRHYTDSAGVVAFHEPGLMGQTVFFHVKSHGYQLPKDGFGYRGVRLKVAAGKRATIEINRINIAQRVYRVTGAGIYRDSTLVGRKALTKKPLLNGLVFGSDSVVNAVFNGRLYWFWGDTNRPSYPLGNFHVPGAVSRLPGDGGLDPEVGVDLEYFLDKKGFAKSTAKLPGAGPTWINGLVKLDDNGKERLFASYVKVKPLLTVYERGLAEFSDETKTFSKVTEFDMQAPVHPTGHPFVHRTADREYVYFGNPFPVVRVPADSESLRDLSKYECYTCLKEGARKGQLDVVRESGKPVFAWKRNTIPFTPKLQQELVAAKLLKREESLFQLHDEKGKPILIHAGSVAWNDYRQRWIMIAVQSFGSSLLGEVWYGEASKLTGPWQNARRIVTHDNYSFYNPKHHPVFDKDGGKTVFFEGTYTSMFSGNKDRTPRYDYNQIMYKLDLSDPRLR